MSKIDPAASLGGLVAERPSRAALFERLRLDYCCDGRQTLAHELVHVVQQRSGPVDGAATGEGVRVSDPGDAFEQSADRTAAAAMTAPVAVPTAAPLAVSRAADEEEDEDAQRVAVSRKSDEDEDEDVQTQREA